MTTSRRRDKQDNRWKDIDGGAAFIIPYTVLRHANYRRLSPFGHKLIADLACQFTGFNNGYLCAAFSLLEKQGWKSPTTLYKASCECEHYGLIEKTQQGGKNKPNLYAFTWRRIDEKTDKPPLDVRPTLRPSDAWKEERPAFKFQPKTKPRKRRAPKLKVAA